MKKQIKKIIESLDPKILKLKKIKITSFKKLGVGEGNLNYVFKVKDKKFIARINIDKEYPTKSKEEYDNLKIVEKLHHSPNVYYYHKKPGFIILDFIEGHPWRMKKTNYNKKQIIMLARTLADLHSRTNNKLDKSSMKYQYYINEGIKYNKRINKFTKNKFKKELDELLKFIKQTLPKKENHKFGIIHADVCPQNIVETKNDIKLIDWESLRLGDPARDIAGVLIDLKIKDKNLDLFMQEYQKVRQDKDILRRAYIYAVLLRYVYVLWEIMRTHEIKQKKLPKEYLAKTSAQNHINEAKFQQRQLNKLIDVPELNIEAMTK